MSGLDSTISFAVVFICQFRMHDFPFDLLAII
jgi:hypothetical protein